MNLLIAAALLMGTGWTLRGIYRTLTTGQWGAGPITEAAFCVAMGAGAIALLVQ
jgi:hypothetical protein